MKYVQAGSVTALMLGLIWFVGIVTVILYSIGSHVYSVVLLRELQLRSWFALEAGLSVALAHIQDNPRLYVHESEGEHILYAGDWPIDPRQAECNIQLSASRIQGDIVELKGVLYDDKQLVLTVIWILTYTQEEWILSQVRRVYVE